MLEKIVDFAVDRRGLVLLCSLVLLLAGVWVAPKLPIDAVPDVTNVQVMVLTEAPGLSAEEMERFVTYPVEMAMTGLPYLVEQRSITRGGLSAVTLIFSDETDVWFARQTVSERLREVDAEIPDEFGKPQLAPVSTGLGMIYQFVLRSPNHSPMELRDMLQWEIGPQLRSVPGVIEVNAMGGAAKEFQVVLDPRRLSAHTITLTEVLQALSLNNSNVGGGWIERGAEKFTIRGESQFRSLEDIGQVVVATEAEGTPILISHLGEVRVGQALPMGVVTRDGEGEAVTGLVMMLLGQNSRAVVTGVQEKMEEIQRALPAGVEVDVVYDRASFINRTLKTVATNLVEGALLVGIVILVFLGSFRAALLVTLGIPFAMIIALFGMLQFKLTGSLMSLGAIDFGLLVDGPIVMVEAVIARLAIAHVKNDGERIESIRSAFKQVARPVVFSVLIILLVYLPLLTLEGTEGKMFRPMAATMGLALFGSVVFSLITFPAAAAQFLKGIKHHEGGFFEKMEHRYQRLVRAAIERRKLLLSIAGIALVAVVPVAMNLGADFIPRIGEGDILVAIRRQPSISLSEARRLDLETERVLKTFPEVVTQVGMTGRAEVATDPVDMDNTDILVRLKPQEEWTTAHDLEGLATAMKERVESEVPSTYVSISQPIEDRTNEMISGSRADISIMLFGDDLNRMTTLARQIGSLAERIPGAGDVRVERLLGLPMLNVKPSRSRISRYGMNSDEVLQVVEASRQGMQAGLVFEQHRRYDLKLLLPPVEQSVESFERIPVGTNTGQLIPLGQVARILESDGPSVIGRQNLARRIRVEVNVRGRDMVSYVNEARALIEREVPMPEGYRLVWGGQFDNFQRASARLAVVVPIALTIIFVMLFFAFGSVRYALAVFSGVPFALIGGIVGLKLRDMPFSIPAAVGFIALCGIAVLNGVVMASEIKRRIEAGESSEEALVHGASSVFRAMLLTATVAAIGFFPMAISHSAGSEVQRPLATAVIGGMVSSTLLGLFVLPGLLKIFLKNSSEHIPVASDTEDEHL